MLVDLIQFFVGMMVGIIIGIVGRYELDRHHL